MSYERGELLEGIICIFAESQRRAAQRFSGFGIHVMFTYDSQWTPLKLEQKNKRRRANREHFNALNRAHRERNIDLVRAQEAARKRRQRATKKAKHASL